MPIVVTCSCGKQLRARDEFAGRQAKCPTCGNILNVPLLAAPEPIYEPEDHPSIPYDVTDQPLQPLPTMHRAPAARSTSTAPRPVNTSPAQPKHSFLIGSGPATALRHWIYFIFLLALIPLALHTLRSGDSESIKQRFAQTLAHHPEIRAKLAKLETTSQNAEDEFFNVLPEHRFEGAFLGHDTYAHWALAMIAGLAFLGIITLMFPTSRAKWLHLLAVALFTGTAGILLLLGVQWIAFHTSGFGVYGHGRAAILMLLIKFIGFSYRAALDPDNGFLLNALGFTLGVGFCEELCKTLPLFWHFRKHATLSWRAACLWGLASGVGFGVSEGITYSSDFYNGVQSGGIYLVRFISCVGLHAMWAGASAILIYKNQDKVSSGEWATALPIILGVPMLLHGLYDTLLKKDMNSLALLIAILSFAWLAFAIEWTRWQEEKHGLWDAAALPA